MLSIDYALSIPGFSTKEIGYQTLVRAERADLEVQITNDLRSTVSKLNVKIILESYVGQIKPILFMQSDPRIVSTIPSKGMIPVIYNIYPTFPGLVAISIHVTDSFNNVVKAKRTTEESYKESPVRFWFHVLDNVSVETLRALKKLVKQQLKGARK